MVHNLNQNFNNTTMLNLLSKSFATHYGSTRFSECYLFS